MGIFGAAKKGFGMLGKARAKHKMLRGTSTRADRLKHGERSPDIKSAKPSFANKDVKDDRYYHNIKKVNEHKKNITEGKKSVKALHGMTKTRQAYFIGKRHGATTSRIHPYNPKQGKKQTGEDL